MAIVTKDFSPKFTTPRPVPDTIMQPLTRRALDTWRRRPSLPASRYVCRSCLRRYHAIRPLQQEAPATVAVDADPPPPAPPADVSTAERRHNDRLLRDIFDSPAAYKAFSSKRHKLRPTGLFANRYLSSPEGFIEFADVCLAKARELSKSICTAESVIEQAAIIRKMDQLSDQLCRVVDLADFTRNTHPDPRFVQAADVAYNTVYNYMNELNTTTGLYTALKAAMADPRVASYGQYGEVELAVGNILLADFEKSGINLGSREKKRFVRLSSDISRVGREFVNEASTAMPFLPLEKSQLDGLSPWAVSKLAKMTNSGKVYLPARGPIAQLALQTVKDAEVRYKLYKEQQTASDQQIGLLEDLLRSRAELAKLVGRTSHAEVTLADKMARTPEAVTAFLHSMLTHTKPLAMAEMEEIASMKREHLGVAAELFAWDKDFYLHKLVEQRKAVVEDSSPDLSAYFSLGTVMQGLSRLFSRLYGVRFVPMPTASGEIWNDDVRRLDVVSNDGDGRVAVVYCDLFQRPEKSPNPAHFTVRCSRQISKAEFREDGPDDDGMAIAQVGKHFYQLPIIALICDFSTPPGSSAPLLAFHEVTTLFHEMGHAIHSILGRTKYHEVAGTRCATDFAELPSILMEHFARSPAVLSLFARHHVTDRPLPPHLLSQRLAASSQLEHTETYQQVLLSMLDQRLHSTVAGERNFSSTAVYQELEREHSLLPFVSGTSWQGYFSHLFGYGSLYYSYMLDKAIADRVWREVFAADPLSREAGERYRDEVLKWGGGRDPWKCLGRLLGREDFETEVTGRMEEVGRWSLEAR
ncbi:Saccharolysin [Drechslerella dactyloides]|uniref:Mitochondrial intermediate peptidase n=1 Tax=Drechslerella dactyloides TaxID=74499 RepID=A0AAD6NKC6_DREDA|nr:Saccharolysin [Drechslerella dactyloides]